VADDFWNCAIIASWVCRRWKPSTLSLDCHGTVLPAVSRRDRIGTHVSASLLAPAATDCGAATKHFSYHAARCSDARLVVRRRNLSGLILVRCRFCSCRGVDDLPKTRNEGSRNTGKLDRHARTSFFNANG